MSDGHIIFSNDPATPLENILVQYQPSKVFVLADTNTAEIVLPRLVKKSPAVAGSEVIVIGAGDVYKNIDSLADVWRSLTEGGATRRSVLINLGGGMVSDLGGFAAACFKRGIHFINIPTTLLAAVDASVGGKTGINFGGYKNEVGAFCQANAVIISTCFFDTLPYKELLSGYAEMLKHALLEDFAALDSLLSFEIDSESCSSEKFLEILRKSIAVKQAVVDEDPLELDRRRILNLGHTAGHAFETLALRRGCPVPHGYAVAWGLIVELVLSHMLYGLPTTVLYNLADFIRTHYGTFDVTCDDYPVILDIMGHDKKNKVHGVYNFTLLRLPGDAVCGVEVSSADIRNALDIFRDLFGI